MIKFGFGGQGLSGDNDIARELTRAKTASRRFHAKRKRKYQPRKPAFPAVDPTTFVSETFLIKAK